MRILAFFISIFILTSSTSFADSDAGQPQNVESVTVLAASSLTVPISQASKIYSRDHSVDVNAVFENSSELLNKIEDGDPADIVITSSGKWMDKMQEKGLIDPSSRVILANNRISLVTALEFEIDTEDKKVEELLDFIHSRALMVIGEPGYVRLGDVTIEMLKEVGKWRKFRKFMVLAPTSSKTMDLIIKSQTAGIVYTTDAMLYEDQIEHLGVIPQKLHSPIEYHAALVVGNNMIEARKYLTFLNNKKVKAVFKRNRFVIE